jgi:hypothetical protein
VIGWIEPVVASMHRGIDEPMTLTEATAERPASDRSNRLGEPPYLQREAAAGLDPVMQFGLGLEHAGSLRILMFGRFDGHPWFRVDRAPI